jgi:hypothetical protein
MNFKNKLMKVYTKVLSGPVYFRRENLDELPDLPDIAPYYIREMDPQSEIEICEWLKIINQAFNRNYTKDDFYKAIINHKIYDVFGTYFLMLDEEYVGVVSAGVFKQNSSVGVTHYLGLNNKFSGKGFGKLLILFCLHEIQKCGATSCEGESTLNYKQSINIHFNYRFVPKFYLDIWNTPNKSLFFFRILTNKRMAYLYKKWKIKTRRNKKVI